MSPRTPREGETPAMAPLARLPVFYALQGKRVLVAGEASAIAWKVELLTAAGAIVDVQRLGELAPHHFSGAAMAIAACSEEAEAARFATMARAAGVPVNVIDRPDFSDFSFGAIVNRSPLVVGISTDGAAPVLAQAIRARIEAIIPAGFAHWAEAALRWRPRLKSSDLSFEARRRFWQLFTARALHHPEQAPADAVFDTLLGATRTERHAAESGSVTLVGAGPGDAELLTLRAVRALQSADVILIDDLVSPEVMDFARREAKKLMVGKTGHGPACKQDEINALMIKLAKSGKRVVRLKGGDPMIFGRAGEEIAACRAAGIAVDVVPGITAAQGAAARLGISLSHRAHARRIQYVTGHDKDGRLPHDMDWHSLADPAATTVVYMPKRTIAELTTGAIAHGIDPATPAIAIANATRPDEATVTGTIADIAVRLEHAAITGPVLVLFGQALAAPDEQPRWQPQTSARL